MKNIEQKYDFEKAEKKRKFKNTINKTIRYTVLILVGLIMLYPLLWMIGSSFKENSEIFTSIGIIPKKLDFSGYVKGWETSTEYTFARYFSNSLMIAIPKVILTVISATLSAYAFARFDFPGKKIFFALLIATLMLPNLVLRIPQYLMFKQFNWLDTFKPLVVPAAFATEGFFVFMIVQYIKGLPTDLEQAAKIDGCNSLQTLIYVLVPIIKPSMISAGLFQFMWTMNDFLGPLIYISSVGKYPISIALKMSMDATTSVQWSSVLAMSVIALIPSLLVFFLGQKYFVDGVSSTGMK
ncbi:MAG: carbohydrate ABC transporter permease [Miniphocaeibacter sp.]|uniref:carbohydrate ABC transporter permease n=1 Tax=Miniphocaeibacter sp. TaxID=3100973 RepID=UPI00182A8E8D|nr:carbohydrate ABC transporter permease [Gallicola sp.]